MLTVDRNDLTSVFHGGRHDKLACRDDGLLVGQPDPRKASDSGKRRTQPCKAAEGVDADIGGKRFYHFTDAVPAGKNRCIGVPDGNSERFRGNLVSDCGIFGPESADLLFSKPDIAPESDGVHFEAEKARYIQRLCSNGARRAQNGDMFLFDIHNFFNFFRNF